MWGNKRALQPRLNPLATHAHASTSEHMPSARMLAFSDTLRIQKQKDKREYSRSERLAGKQGLVYFSKHRQDRDLTFLPRQVSVWSRSSYRCCFRTFSVTEKMTFCFHAVLPMPSGLTRFLSRQAASQYVRLLPYHSITSSRLAVLNGLFGISEFSRPSAACNIPVFPIGIFRRICLLSSRVWPFDQSCRLIRSLWILGWMTFNLLCAQCTICSLSRSGKLSLIAAAHLSTSSTSPCTP